jgi:alpha-amylase/alpha-mannosidase (GH57 family)
LSRFHLVLLLHAHQPVGNFDAVFERAYQQCYLPFLDPLERHPGVRAGLHFSGPLWEWIGELHQEYFTRLRALVERGQVELVGGGFYEPILVSIPPADRAEQIARMERFLTERFGTRPEGAWLTERVWEPHLAETLAKSGVGYTLVDDNHFLLAGFEPEQLFGYYRVEDLDSAVDIYPGLERLRYFIPFHAVEETIDLLRRAANEHPGGMAAMGDDLEKFGIWPGTYKHCYEDGWLERFFQALEDNADWLTVTTPGEYRRLSRPLGAAVLPTAAYSEMMEWALPTPARQRVEALVREFSGRPEVQRSLRRGMWRNFLVKYPEADLLVRKVQYVSRRLSQRAKALRRSDPARLDEARTRLLRAQCNDAYWHGIFGGLYSPHLREALWREVIEAEHLIEGDRSPVRSRRDGLGAPQRDELYFTSARYSALVDCADGATLSSLDLRTAGVPLINSVARRPEAYHARLAHASAGDGSQVASIHDRVRVKEPGLERLLRYDRWRRHSFRLMVFPEGKQPGDYAALALAEAAGPAGAPFAVKRISAGAAELEAEVSLDPVAACHRAHCAKHFRFRSAGEGFSAAATVQLKLLDGAAIRCRAGLEFVVNLLAPASSDRYIAFGAERHPLGWEGVVPGGELRLVDEWRKVATEIVAPGADELWIAPIETVSESEEGFERVYQGSQILAIWPLELAPGKELWEAQAEIRVSRL